MESIDFKERFSFERPYRSGFSNKHVEEKDISKFQKQLESDRGRIMFSPAIRRLQQKTQVFPLERNAAVRSRLAHSLEVQQYGRFIVHQIFEKLGPEEDRVGLSGMEKSVESLVEMSCLMHDIGNPPFGHFGESAISNWFSCELASCKVLSKKYEDVCLNNLAGKLKSDLENFEGNAQAIREPAIKSLSTAPADCF